MDGNLIYISLVALFMFVMLIIIGEIRNYFKRKRYERYHSYHDDYFDDRRYFKGNRHKPNKPIFRKVITINNIDESSWNWYSVQEFRRKTKKGYTKYDFKGVYIIYDVDMNCYYVGQSINVIKRLRGHFNGQSSKGGADDLNEALISGHNMEIALLRLQNSSFRDLDDMEAYFIDYFDSYYIDYFDSYYNGYNRTRGNYVEFRTMGPVHRGGHYVKSFVLR